MGSPQSLIKLIQITLINEQIERACFEKKMNQHMPLYYLIGLVFYKKDRSFFCVP
jgi:hypothetical protein